jgi:pimeloyl-ACP methyl ester carboxylesterase
MQSSETIVYLHGNGGSKLEALPLIQYIPKYGIAIAAFDLLGCGSSDEETLTYGVNEVFDIRDVLQEIRKITNASRVTLWGRSMGAMCSIMFAEMYSYEVNGLILDSPFRCLSSVIDRVAAR